MKTFTLLVLSVIALTVGQLAEVRAAQLGKVTLQYVHPEKFTDFSIYGRDYRWSASYFTSEIGSYLQPRLSRKFPGSSLTLRFTNIDLAGESRTTRRGSDVRISRGERHPPRMSFDFLLQDSGGRTLANGSTRITGASQLGSVPRSVSSQALYDEKRMLEKWLKSIRAS
jgi:Protein of unknown function (DUF3016)